MHGAHAAETRPTFCASAARAEPTSDENCGTTPGGGSAPLMPPSPSKMQLLETLDELIEKEKEVKLLAEQLVRKRRGEKHVRHY